MAHLMLRVWPEYLSSGVWELEEPGQWQAGRHISHRSLRLPDDLSGRFTEWIEVFDRSCPVGDREPDIDWDAFAITMITLAKDLKAFLGADAYVEYEIWGRYFAVGEPPS